MAKAKDAKPQEVEVEVVETAETQEVNDGNQPAAEAAAPATTARVSTSPKMVKVHAIEDINCMVGGNRYTAQKGKEFQVPMDVAFILANSQKVYRV